jgi:hypothetical protein
LDWEKRTGGLLVLISKNLDIKISLENIFSSETLEFLHFSISFKVVKPINIILFYRSPSYSTEIFIDIFFNFLNNIDYINYPLIIFGDINYDFLKINIKNDIIYNTFLSYGLNLLVKKPTRLTLTSQTCIDWILTNNFISNYINFNDIKNISIPFSDRNCLIFTYKKHLHLKTKPIIVKKCIFDDLSILNFLNTIKNTCDFSNLNTYIINLHNHFVNNFKFIYIPIIPKTNQTYNANWLSTKTYNLITIKNKEYNNYLKKKDTNSLSNYKKLKHLCEINIYHDKNNFFSNYIIKNNTYDPKKCGMS